ncbi:MAG: hypothetical protein COV99_09900 [Bacteroidetes bacterium CG12_big_fil_rev_8_21_14_0_65_60_17]|nr:MAG: hypothetical protein COV99_09900 [Bacteroidetes bacterium CG12_big_fil_rev_8_21_14_0_65_60_17]
MQKPFSLRFRAPVLASVAVAAGLATSLLIPRGAAAQDGADALRFLQQLPGITATSNGIAGAGIGGRTDASAFRTNPAGLAWNDKSWFSASLSNQNVSDEAIFNAPGSTTRLEPDVSSTGLASLAYAYKVPTTQGRLVVGAGFNQTSSYDRSLFYDGTNNANSITDFFMPLPGEFELNEDADGVFPTFTRDLSFIAFETFGIDLSPELIDAGETVPFLPAVSAGTVRQLGAVEEDGRMTELSFAGAVEVSKDVMIGVSINIPFGEYDFLREHTEEDFQNDNDGTGGTTDFSSLRFTESFSSDFVGVNARFGLSALVAPGARIGLTIETPTYISVEESFNTVLETTFDNGDHFVYGDGLTETAGSGNFDYSITSPWKIGVGGSFDVSGLTLLADVEWMDWSQLELDADGFSFEQKNQEIRRSLDQVLNARFGAEYRIDKLTLRGGMAVYPDPRDTDSPLANLDDVDRDRTYFSAGLGYAFSSDVSASISWIQGQFDDQFRPYTDVAGAPVVGEEVTTNRVLIGFTFGF